MNKKQTAPISVHQQGVFTLPKVKKTISDFLSEVFIDTKIDCQLHQSDNEIISVFIANGICATLHIQAFQPKKKGGRS